MTKVFLIVSVACNVWFLLMLLSDRITETKFVRFLKGAAGLWRSLGTKSEKQEAIILKNSTVQVVGSLLQPNFYVSWQSSIKIRVSPTC